MRLTEYVFRGITLTVFFAVFAIVYFAVSFQFGVKKVNQEWEEDLPSKIEDFGSTKTLSILPLVNWHTNDDSLKGEAGVSYLIKTDRSTILFDVGFNQKSEFPSPLEHNMDELGVKLDDIDTIFLSHAHLDHRGGQKWVNENTFSLGLEQVDLSNKKIYAPTLTRYPDAEVNLIPEETIIGEGIAGLGAISRQLVIGRIEENALVINVEGKGLVVIVGCGHQTVPKILDRVEKVFSTPLYGLVGDLHYPIPEGRLNILGINLQRIFASGEGPHSPITYKTMKEEIELLKKKGVKVIALGGHDTSDKAIESFNLAFGENYQHIRVGAQIDISK